MFELTRWSPFGSVFHLHRELDDMLGRFLGQERRRPTGPRGARWPGRPRSRATPRTAQIHVRVALPGVDPKDVEVTVSDDHLTIRGERKAEHGGQDGGRYVREFTYGSFERTFALPDGIDPGKVQAKFANGMLDLTMPTPVAVVPKKVEIQIESGGGPGQGRQGRLTPSGDSATGSSLAAYTRPPGVTPGAAGSLRAGVAPLRLWYSWRHVAAARTRGRRGRRGACWGWRPPRRRGPSDRRRPPPLQPNSRQDYDPAAVLVLLDQAGVRRGVRLEHTRRRDGASSTRRRRTASFRCCARIARRGSSRTWHQDPTVVPYLEQRLARPIYRGIGEFHLTGSDARAPVVRQVAELAARHGLFLHCHCDAEAVEDSRSGSRRESGCSGPTPAWARGRTRWGVSSEPRRSSSWSSRSARTWRREGSWTRGGGTSSCAIPTASWWGPTPGFASRWASYVDVQAAARAWLRQLPPDLARRLASENAESLARGGSLTPAGAVPAMATRHPSEETEPR